MLSTPHSTSIRSLHSKPLIGRNLARLDPLSTIQSMSKNSSFAEIADVISSHDSFVILSHIRPDGDAIGSTIAIGHALEQMGKTVYYINEDGVPDNLKFLPGSEKVTLPPAEPLDVQIAIAVDCATKPRLGDNALNAASKAKTWINIDHHVSNPKYGDYNHIDSISPATGQILYNLITDQELPFSELTRDSIYVAVSTDTGSFQYSNTTAATYKMAADLVERGVNVGEINALTYDSNPYRRIELLRSLLNTLELSESKKVADWQLLNTVKLEYKLKPEDSEDLIDLIRGIEGVLVAAFFEELPDGKIRVSLRAKDDSMDCSEVAGIFKGGGHKRAAGIRMDGPIAEARTKVLAAVNEAIGC